MVLAFSKTFEKAANPWWLSHRAGAAMGKPLGPSTPEKNRRKVN
jgi:hypothetical protein